MQVYTNGGHSTDQSIWVLDHMLNGIDNGYNLENARILGRCCKTNLPTGTAMRGFGKPQAAFIIETVMERIATGLKLPREKVNQSSCIPVLDFMSTCMRVDSRNKYGSSWRQNNYE